MDNEEAERYRQLALELRGRAVATPHANMRESMLKIAAEYERLIDFLEQERDQISN